MTGLSEILQYLDHLVIYFFPIYNYTFVKTLLFLKTLYKFFFKCLNALLGLISEYAH